MKRNAIAGSLGVLLSLATVGTIVVPMLPAVAQSEDDRKAEADRLFQQGIEQIYSSQFDEALQSWEAALDIYREIGDRTSEASSLKNLGFASMLLGKYQDALDFYQQALEIDRELGDLLETANSLDSLGNIHAILGQNERALELFQEAVDIRRSFGTFIDRRALAGSLGYLGNTYLALGQTERALELYQEAYDNASFVSLGGGPQEVMATALGNLGGAYFFLEQYERAITYYEQALDIKRELGDRRSTAVQLGNLGNVHFILGDYPKAIEVYQEALDLGREFQDLQIENIALRNLGSVYFEMKDLDLAEEHLRAAIVILESLRENLSDANQVSIFDVHASAYNLLKQVLIADDRPLEALEISERARSRAFINLLAQRIGVRNAEEFEVEPPTIDDIQRIAADRNATLVEYAVVSDELYIWVVSPSGDIDFRSVEFEEDDSVRDTAIAATIGAQTGRGGNVAIRDLVRGTRASVVVEATDTESDRRIRRSQESYQVLIEPIADLLPDDPEAKVIFIPHQELFLVPFAALEDEEGNYLIEKHTILTAPSIQVLDLTRENRRPLQEENAVVVGNPQMPTLPNDTTPLASLPGSEAEAIAIAQQLQTDAIIGNNATETNIVPQLNTASIIHLATHGLLDDLGTDIPGAIALTPTETDDGFLTASEIFGMDLNAALVVLSACNTGRGDITGDGVVGLSRSFFSAGTPSLVVSLWAVPDEPTRALMVEFYRQLEDDPDKAKALRNAMLATMETHPHPRNWAAFTLMGEAE